MDSNKYCELCSKTYRNKKSLGRHFNIVHKALKNYKCDKCEKAYGRVENLREHVKIAHENNGIKPYSCSKCEIKFSRKSSLHSHIKRIHEGYTKYFCEICNKHLFDLKQLEIHQQSKEHLENATEECIPESKTQNFQCIFCKNVFESQEQLKNHLHQEGCKQMREKVFSNKQAH